MAKKLTVTTDVGTFTRTTARTYTHIVVANQTRYDILEAHRLENIKSTRADLARYSDPVAHRESFLRRGPGREWDVECYDRYLADGSFAKWAQDAADRLAQLEATGPITADVVTGFGIVGWCGRADLAAKLFSNDYTVQRAREARIYALDGTRVR